eukprot:scpid48385/ scgid5218/ 
MRLRMQGLRQLCKDFNIPYQGRVSRRDLYLLICEHFHLSTAGEGVPDEEADKPALPKPVMAAYKKLPSFSHITSGWSLSRLTKIPFFITEAVKHYLLNSPEKDYDKESLQCYKQLRAYQLFDEHHLHHLEGNLFAGGTNFCFVRAKCWPSQDTSKQAYTCIVCISRDDPVC